MPIVLLAVFIAIPLIEIAILVKVGQWIGVWMTIGLVVGLALLGTWLLRRQGFAALVRAREALARGEPPVDEVLDGVFILLAGAFLLTPGLLTDVMGLVLLITPVRRFIARRSFDYVLSRGGVRVRTSRRQAASGERRRPEGTGDVIEGEFERLDERTVRPRGNGKEDPEREKGGSPWKQ